jgi:hypothetical protein
VNDLEFVGLLLVCCLCFCIFSPDAAVLFFEVDADANSDGIVIDVVVAVVAVENDDNVGKSS